MQTLVIAGGTVDSRSEYILTYCQTLGVHPVDRTILTSDSSIGIEAVRLLHKQLQFKPLSGTSKVLWVKDASLLTIESQQALLKTLEEPPKNTLIILETQSEEVLLPTILSRVVTVKLPLSPAAFTQEQREEYLNLWKRLLTSDPITRLTLIPQFGKERSSYQEFVSTQLNFLHSLLQENLIGHELPEFSLATLYRLITTLLETQKHLAHNITASACLDQFLLSF